MKLDRNCLEKSWAIKPDQMSKMNIHSSLEPPPPSFQSRVPPADLLTLIQITASLPLIRSSWSLAARDVELMLNNSAKWWKRNASNPGWRHLKIPTICANGSRFQRSTRTNFSPWTWSTDATSPDSRHMEGVCICTITPSSLCRAEGGHFMTPCSSLDTCFGREGIISFHFLQKQNELLMRKSWQVMFPHSPWTTGCCKAIAYLQRGVLYLKKKAGRVRRLSVDWGLLGRQHGTSFNIAPLCA